MSNMDFKTATASQLAVWANLHQHSCAAMVELIGYVDARAANQITSGQIQTDPAAMRNFLAMVDLLETSVVAHDGYLDRVYEDVRRAPYMRKLWDKLGKREFVEALAMSLHNAGVPVRGEYADAPVADSMDALEDQWKQAPYEK